MTDAFLRHIGYISWQAEREAFKNKAHVQYDQYVRETADSIGWEAFKAGNVNGTLQCYSITNLIASSATSVSTKTKSAKGKKKSDNMHGV